MQPVLSDLKNSPGVVATALCTLPVRSTSREVNAAPKRGYSFLYHWRAHAHRYSPEYVPELVGYVGRAKATPILLDGLRRLEYRGYDSAGLAIVEKGHSGRHANARDASAALAK